MVNSNIIWKNVFEEHPEILRELYIFAFSIDGEGSKEYIHKIDNKAFDVIKNDLIKKIDSGFISLSDFIRHKGFEVSLISPFLDNKFYGFRIFNEADEIAISSLEINTAKERDNEMTALLVKMLSKSCKSDKKAAIRRWNNLTY